MGRLKAFLVHLSITSIVASLAALMVFGVWYPDPYRTISGGLELFVLVVGVDLVIGPLSTAIVFNSTKTRRHLRIDLLIIALLQLACLAYGVHTVFVARPVYMVFEVDRFRVLSAIDLDKQDLALAAKPYRQLPLFGPRLVGTRRSAPGAEQLQSIELALRGKDLSQRPKFYQDYALSRQEVLSRAKSPQILIEKYSTQMREIEAAMTATGLEPNQLRYVPLVARRQWVAFVDAKTADIVGYAPFDGF